MRYIRRAIYRLGIRPKPGSIFFSPSLHMIMWMELRGKAHSYGFKRGMDQANVDRVFQEREEDQL